MDGRRITGPESGDALDRLLIDARREAPAGLAMRLARGARDAGAIRRVFWMDIERAARRLLPAAAAAALLAASLVAGGVFDGGADQTGSSDATIASTHDDMAELALSTGAFERQLSGDLADDGGR